MEKFIIQLNEISSRFFHFENYADVQHLPFEEIVASHPDRLPNAMSWDAEKVARFFAELGFVKEAGEFADRNLHGKALLQLSADDLVRSFGFKVGPALKIGKHVKLLRWKIVNIPRHSSSLSSIVFYND